MYILKVAPIERQKCYLMNKTKVADCIRCYSLSSICGKKWIECLMTVLDDNAFETTFIDIESFRKWDKRSNVLRCTGFGDFSEKIEKRQKNPFERVVIGVMHNNVKTLITYDIFCNMVKVRTEIACDDDALSDIIDKTVIRYNEMLKTKS